MKKILLLSLATYSNVGGIENYNKNFIEALSQLENYESDVISIYDSNKESINLVKTYNFDGNKLKAILFFLKIFYKYDIIITTHINLLPFLKIAKLFKPSINILISAHGIEVWKKFNIIDRLFFKKMIFLPVSNYTKKKMIELNNLEENNFKLLFNCIKINDNDHSFSNPYDTNDFNILSVTRLDSRDSYKGIDSVIKALPSIIKEIPNIKYTIIGKGDDRSRLENLTAKLNVEKYISFQGFVNSIEVYYEYTDIFILPSKGEGFGIVYIEAMKYKKPCIACDEGGQTDVVIDGKNGYLCHYNSIECLSKKIHNLFQDKNLRKEFGKNGYRHLVDNFTFDAFQNRLKNILDV